jgi:protocatechuate 3,4-dioxygenase beta subunit
MAERAEARGHELPVQRARGRRRGCRLALATLLAAPACRAETAAAPPAREPIVGLPCEGCEWVFEGMPAEPPSSARIAPPEEPGEPLRIEGTVRDGAGRPVPGVVVYAYHTDANGIYPRLDPAPGRPRVRHGRLRGWARSDETGRYAFDTIRPAGYPGTRIPQHVHLHVVEPGRCSYYIDDLQFDDDPRLTAAERSRLRGRGGSGVAAPRRDPDGRWRATRDIVLGAKVPGYEACATNR